MHPPRRRRRARVAGVVVAVAVVAGAMAVPGPAAATSARPCPGTGPELGPPEIGGDATPGVTRIVYTFVDRSRPTRPDGGRGDDVACRVLKTAVRIPTGAVGPMPLILAVHGVDGDPSSLVPLLDAWVTAGYVVAAPFFLVTAKNADDDSTPSASSRQAADARFVLDQLLALDADPTSLVHGLLDPDRIGAAGMSLGGLTVYGLVANTCCRDHRVSAAILLAGVYRPLPHGTYKPHRVPALLIQGDRDKGYHNSVSAYPMLKAPKWFITLHGATHSPPFEIPRGPRAAFVDDTTTAFWNAYLGDQSGAAHRIVRDVAASHGAASLRRRLRAR